MMFKISSATKYKSYAMQSTWVIHNGLAYIVWMSTFLLYVCVSVCGSVVKWLQHRPAN